MNEERRANSIEAVLISLGRLETSSEHIKSEVSNLNQRVGVQNGKVGRLERWQAYTQGAVTILIVMMLPIVINVVSGWLQIMMQKSQS